MLPLELSPETAMEAIVTDSTRVEIVRPIVIGLEGLGDCLEDALM